MADSETVSPIKILKNSKILVNVEEVIQDILVVSYVIESKLYEGVLLDSTKKALPCGVSSVSLAGLFSVASTVGSPRGGDAGGGGGGGGSSAGGGGGGAADEDRMYSVGQRFSYSTGPSAGAAAAAGASPGHGGGGGAAPPFHLRRAVRPPARYKTARMTVRLRPRQVLCSKCRSICNENSENVDLSRGGRRSSRGSGAGAGVGVPPGAEDSADRRPSPRPLFSENQRDNQPRMGSPPGADAKLCSSLIPKLSRLQPSEITSAMGGGAGGAGAKLKLVGGGYWARHAEPAPAPAAVALPTRVMAPAAAPHPLALLAPVSATEQQQQRMHPVALPAASLHGGSPAASPVASPDDGGDVDADGDDSDVQVSDGALGRMVLRKKRSVGSMEDLWDESVFEAEALSAKRHARAVTAPFAASAAPTVLRAGAAITPVIKISFGRQGEGTVLKIPSRVRSLSDTCEGAGIGSDGGVDVDVVGEGGVGGAGNGGGGEGDMASERRHASAKAAKKALKKAKREARRKLLGGASPAYETLYPRRRKHKVKHKKKHRDERRHEREAAAAAVAAVGVLGTAHALGGMVPEVAKATVDDVAAAVVAEADEGVPGETYSAIKERCLKQKLSISLKRLNANAYMRCDSNGVPALPLVGGKSPTASSCSNSEELSDADHGEAVPDFPAPMPLPRAAHLAVASCLTGDGRRMAVGDVVWGKIHGFPWWPGKVLSITLAHKDDGGAPSPQAHVAWYGSSTSSLMPCDQLSPFLETFKARYNKKKRGPYKEAIRQATSEARRESHIAVDGNVPLAASPREVNVAS